MLILPQLFAVGVKMPEENGKLTPEDIKLADEWLTGHWQNRACASCGRNDRWAIQGTLAQIIQFSSPGNILVGGPTVVYPTLVIMCHFCGYMMTFNAITLGLVKRAEEKEEKQSGTP